MATRIRVIAYGPEGMHEERDVDVARTLELRDQWAAVWIDVVGLAHNEALTQLRDGFGLHPLVLEDVVNTGQRPKLEEYEDYDFIVLRVVPPELGERTDQLSLVLRQNCVITFQERHHDCLEPVRERFRRNMGRVRQSGPDYLAYAVIDAVIDHYVPELDRISERTEALEREIITRPDPGLVARIYELRHHIQELRRAVRPVVDVVSRLHNEEVPLFSREVKPYLRDCFDHAVRLADATDHHREMAIGLMELHLASMSQRMNEVMKVLTIIATIFIPLSFVAGVYGMNFETSASRWNMPELSWSWGYPAVLGLMALMVAGMLLYFYFKGWLGQRGSRKRRPRVE